MLLPIIITVLQIPAFALSAEAESQLKGMGNEAMKWYNLLLAVAIPLFIVRLASYGFMILGTAFLSKGEFQLDAIKKDIMYTILAILGIILFPTILSWAKGLVKPNAWKPHTVADIVSFGGMVW